MIYISWFQVRKYRTTDKIIMKWLRFYYDKKFLLQLLWRNSQLINWSENLTIEIPRKNKEDNSLIFKERIIIVEENKQISFVFVLLFFLTKNNNIVFFAIINERNRQIPLNWRREVLPWQGINKRKYSSYTDYTECV